MGQAKRRKLAGTYPKQDGGPWGLMPPEMFEALTEKGRQHMDAIIFDCIDAAGLRDALTKSLSSSSELEAMQLTHSRDEMLLVVAYEMISIGIFLLWMRPLPDGRDDLEHRIELNAGALSEMEASATRDGLMSPIAPSFMK